MFSVDEMREKKRRIEDFMQQQGLDVLALSTIANFAWSTCGGSNYVGTATEVGNATAVFARDAKYLVCDNIEEPRIRDEELEGQGFEFRPHAWYEARRNDIIREIARGGVVGSDVPMEGAADVSAAFDPVRYSLTPQEIDRYRWLGRQAGECLSAACREIEPGMTEHEIAGVLDAHIYSRGIVPGVTLIAVDERIERYRHPLPTDRALKRCAMLVTAARRWGLIVSATRLVHFGELTGELRRKHDAVTRVDAAFVAGTVPGAVVGEVFRRAQEVYAETGYADEWKLHHQGGPTGYKGREFRANAASEARVAENQAFAWNPSITGTKSEDTIIAAPRGQEIISATDDWPKVGVEMDGQVVPRPDILVR